jgi:hypothetical protein
MTDMSTMYHEPYLWAEIDYRRGRLLAEAEDHRRRRLIGSGRRAGEPGRHRSDSAVA